MSREIGSKNMETPAPGTVQDSIFNLPINTRNSCMKTRDTSSINGSTVTLEYLQGDSFPNEYRQQLLRTSSLDPVPTISADDPLISVLFGSKFGAIGERLLLSRRHGIETSLNRNAPSHKFNSGSLQANNVVNDPEKCGDDGGNLLPLVQLLDHNNLIAPKQIEPFGNVCGFHQIKDVQRARLNSYFHFEDIGNTINEVMYSTNSVPANERPQYKNCCCFCYGTAFEWSKIHGYPTPKKDDFGEWSTHCSKKEGKVVCPKLRAMVCKICGATGDNAHTTKHHRERGNVYM